MCSNTFVRTQTELECSARQTPPEDLAVGSPAFRAHYMLAWHSWPQSGFFWNIYLSSGENLHGHKGPEKWHQNRQPIIPYDAQHVPWNVAHNALTLQAHLQGSYCHPSPLPNSCSPTVQGTICPTQMQSHPPTLSPPNHPTRSSVFTITASLQNFMLLGNVLPIFYQNLNSLILTCKEYVGIQAKPRDSFQLLGTVLAPYCNAHPLTWEWTTQFYHTAQHTASSETSAKELHGAPIQKKLLYHHRLVNAIGVGNRKPKDSAEIAFCVTRCQTVAKYQTESTLKVLTVSYSKCQNQSPFFKCSLLPCSVESRVWSAIQTHSVCLSDIISLENLYALYTHL